jgi:hypothetical protein
MQVNWYHEHNNGTGKINVGRKQVDLVKAAYPFCGGTVFF